MSARWASALSGAVTGWALAAAETWAGYRAIDDASLTFFAIAGVAYGAPLAIAGAAGALEGRWGVVVGLAFTALRIVTDGFDVRGGVVPTSGSPTMACAAIVVLGAVLVGRFGRITHGAFVAASFVLPTLAAGAAGRTSSDVERLGTGACVGALVAAIAACVERWERVRLFFLALVAIGCALGSRPEASGGVFALDAPRGVRSSAALVPANGPDIALVVLDAARPSSLAMYGYSRVTMPRLEAFAREATVFTRAWSHDSWTVPSHASLFSGLRPVQHRYDTAFPARERLDPAEFVASRLRSRGYATGAFVANAGAIPPDSALLDGFDVVWSRPERPLRLRPALIQVAEAMPDAPGLSRVAERYRAAFARGPTVVDRARRFWRSASDRPRFLFVNLMEPHSPWSPSRRSLGAFGPARFARERQQERELRAIKDGGAVDPGFVDALRARYDECLLDLDEALGDLLDAVRADSRRELVVVVTADHGDALGENGQFGHRRAISEVETRIPLVIRARSLAVGRNESLAQLVDVHDFLAREAGLEPRAEATSFGERREVVLEHWPSVPEPLPAGYADGPRAALIEWPIKFFESARIGASAFDVAADPNETTNLIGRDPARDERMRARLRTLVGDLSRPARSSPLSAEELARLRALGYVR